MENPWLDELRELIELLNGTSIAELELQDGDLHVAIRRGGSRVDSRQQTVDSRDPVADPVGGPGAAPDGLAYVTAPLLGTFYGSPSPGADPFVREGDQVAIGQVIGLIEAMKIFNEIQAEAAGRVHAILVEDGAFVEADQRLIAIDTRASQDDAG
ncbi:MAG TPA: acetyl-CoA carboxylase [Chloroflexota bacterium]|nr:acetyl-CoA carboxylase [Chloroflexota bacterium]